MSLIRREQLYKLNLLEEGLEQLAEGKSFEARPSNPAAFEIERLLEVAKVAREFPTQGLPERSRAALLASLTVKMQSGVTDQPQVELENKKSEPVNSSVGVAKSAGWFKFLFVAVVAPLCMGLVVVAIGLAVLSYSAAPAVNQPTVPVPTNSPVFTPSPTSLAPTPTAVPTTTPAATSGVITSEATTTAPITTEAGITPSPVPFQTNPKASTAVATTAQSPRQPPPTPPTPKPTAQPLPTAAPDPATTPPALPTERPVTSVNTTTVGVTSRPTTVLETPTPPVTTSRPPATTANPTPNPTPTLASTPTPTTPAVTTTPVPTSPPTTSPPVNTSTLTPIVKTAT